MEAFAACRRASSFSSLESGDLRVQLGFALVGLHQDALRLFLELNHLLGGARATEGLKLGDELLLFSRDAAA